MPYVTPALLCTATRVDEAESARNWLTTAGMLTSAEKINSETPIDSTVRIVRRLLRVRFFSTSIAYFIRLPSARTECEIPRPCYEKCISPRPAFVERDSSLRSARTWDAL